MHPTLAKREPVFLISGVLQALLLALAAFGIPVPDQALDILVSAASIILGLGSAIAAARHVIGRDRPTVVILQGLVPPVVTLLATLGFHLPPDGAAALQGLIAIGSSFFTRQQVLTKFTAANTPPPAPDGPLAADAVTGRPS